VSTILGDKVTAGATTFNDVGTIPTGAAVWKMDQLDGWDETAELDTPITPRGGGVDGAVAGDFFAAQARHLLAGGYVMGTSRALAESLVDSLIGDAFPRNVDILLTRYETVPKFLTVRVSGKREIQRARDGMWFRWVVPLVAPDPLKYGVGDIVVGPVGVAGQSTGGVSFPITFPFSFTTVSGGDENTATVVNVGTATSKPFVTIHGPLVRGGWRLSNETTGSDIRFDVGLTSTDVLTIDFKTQTALLNGYPITTTISGDFWGIVRGANTIKLWADFDPAANFTINGKSAWE
jgi:hypothetical protein